MKALRLLGLLTVPLVLGGCNMVLMSPSGDVAIQQRNLLLASTGLMLLIILPVMALTLFFAWHFRAANKDAVYDPDFNHSTTLEVAIWAVPLLIIVMLGALTWMGTHLLDPYRPIGRISGAKAVVEGKAEADSRAQPIKPLTVEVVALDWKWLFFYPEQGIATVNELAAPVDVPIVFKITSQAVMNSFFIPALAGQIYAMPGMETKLHAVINAAGEYDGFSANYSGAGFSRMRFKFHGLASADFESWVAKVKGDGKPLDRATYTELEKPSEADPVRHYGTFEPGLYGAILNLCTRPGKMCMHEMMAIDAKGGGGKDSADTRERLRYDGGKTSEGNEAPGATFPATGRKPHSDGPAPQGSPSGATTPQGDLGAPASGGGHAGHGGHGSPAPVQTTK